MERGQLCHFPTTCPRDASCKSRWWRHFCFLHTLRGLPRGENGLASPRRFRRKHDERLIIETKGKLFLKVLEMGKILPTLPPCARPTLTSLASHLSLLLWVLLPILVAISHNGNGAERAANGGGNS